jgi:hypothetical protein
MTNRTKKRRDFVESEKKSKKRIKILFYQITVILSVQDGFYRQILWIFTLPDLILNSGKYGQCLI